MKKYLLFVLILLVIGLPLVSSGMKYNHKIVGSWSFEDNLKDSMNGFDGIGSGGFSFVDGKIGKAIHFNGKDSYVELPSEIANKLNKGYGVSLWMRSKDKGESYLVSVTGEGPLNGRYEEFSLLIPSYVKNEFWGEFHDRYYYAKKKINDGYWHHIVMSVNKKTRKVSIYIDGVNYVNEDIKNSKKIVTDKLIRLGMYADRNHLYFPYDGDIDELVIFKKPLNEKQVLRLYNNGYGVSFSN